MLATPAIPSGRIRPGRMLTNSAAIAGCAGIIIAFAAGFQPTIAWVAGEWSSSAGVLSHGYLVAAVSALLFVRSFPDFIANISSPAWWLLPVLVGLSFIWLLGHAATVVAAQTMVLPALLLTAIAMAFGTAAVKVLSFPLLYLYLAVPAWEHLYVVFQTITVMVESALIRLVDIPAFVQGNRVQLPLGTLAIASGCSGLNFIVAGLSLAILYGHLYYSAWRQSVLLTLIMLLLAMVGNWVRVFVIIVVAHQSRMQSPLVDEHLKFGWLVFAFSLIPAYFAARYLERPEKRGSQGQPGAAPRPNGSSGVRWLGVIAAMMAMVSGPVWARASGSDFDDNLGIKLELPAGAGGWRGPMKAEWGWQPRYSGATAERLAEYGRHGRPVLAYTNLYLAQEQGKELVFLKNWIGGDWQRAGSSSSQAAARAGFNGVFATNYAGRWVIWYRYQVGNGFETSEVRTKLKQAYEILRGRPESGIVAFATPCFESCTAAEKTLAHFVDEVGGRVRVAFTTEVNAL